MKENKFDSKPKPACTCGAKSVGSAFHSPWCDSNPKEEVTEEITIESLDLFSDADLDDLLKGLGDPK